jgi:hypothetical protein
VNLLYKLSESLIYYENFLNQEKSYYQKFYYGRWIVLAVIVRFINQVVDKLVEEQNKNKKEEAQKKKEDKAKDGPKSVKAAREKID